MKRFVFWAELERSNFNEFEELFADFSKDELFILYEEGCWAPPGIKDPIREKLIEIYTKEALDHHRKKIKWPLTGTQVIEVESKLYSNAHQLGGI